ncbi:MAG: BACON domain-containing protein [Prevotella sp.]|nr:BACON domain-containing protein [Prevotella sp.]
MKKLYSFIALLAAVTLFTACGDDDATYNPTPKLDVTNVNVLFEAEGGQGSITVNTSSALTATTESEWLTLSVSGKTVTAMAAANNQLDGRSATILLKAGGAESIVTATQKGSVYGLAGGKEYQISDSPDTLYIPVVHTSGVTVESLADWLHASFDEATSQIVVASDGNYEVAPRVGQVAYATGTIQDTLVFTQAGMSFELETDDVSFITNAAGSQTVKVSSTKSINVLSTVDWITASYDETAGVVTVDVAANSEGAARVGYVVVMSGEAQKFITVSQYEFTQEVFGYYAFVYYNSETFQPESLEAALTENGLYLVTPYSETPYVVPVGLDAENGYLMAGPNGAQIGTYYSYNIFLRWAEYVSGIPMADFTDNSPVYGVMSFEEEEDEDGNVGVSGYMDFLGWFGADEHSIDIWVLGASASTFDANNYAGALDYLIYPYMIKVGSLEEPTAEAAPARRALKNKLPAFLKKRGRDKMPRLFSNLPTIRKK